MYDRVNKICGARVLGVWRMWLSGIELSKVLSKGDY